MLLQIEESVYKKMCSELEQLNIANINLKVEINKSNEIKQGIDDSSRTTTNVLEKYKTKIDEYVIKSPQHGKTTTYCVPSVDDKLKTENDEVRKINETLRMEIEELKRSIINIVTKLH